MCIKNICFCHHHNNSSTNNMMSVMLKIHPHKYKSVTVVHLCVWTIFIILSSSELTVESVDLLPKARRVRVMALYIYCPDSIIIIFAPIELVQFSARWHLIARENSYALHTTSQKCPQCCLPMVVWLTLSPPFSGDHLPLHS